MNLTPHRRPMRWWMPATLLLLAGATALYLRAREIPFLEPTLLGIAVLTVLLLGIWFVFFTGLRWKTRFAFALVGAALLAGLVYGIKHFTRPEGSIGGSGIPRLVWKWSPRREGTDRPLTLQPESAAPTRPTPEAVGLQGAGYPQFLGPQRSGTLTAIPLSWDWSASPPKLLWRQPIGLGWSTFAVSGRHAVTQEQRQDDELIVCYELESGSALWAHTNHVRFSEMFGGDGPRATPTIQGGRVYAIGASGILDCLEETTGHLVWSHDVLGENHLSNLTWGKSCSPLVTEGLVVVTGGKEREKTLLAFEAVTGRPVWQAGDDEASYCSPQLASLCGQEQLLIVNAHSVAGHDPLNGRIFWQFPWPDTHAKVTQPLVVDTNQVLVAAGYGVGCVMLKLERSPEGTWSVAPLWKNRNLKPKFTNLVRRGNYVYGLDDGILACVDLEQGNRVWKDGRYGHGQLLLVDDLILIQAESGEVALVDSSPEGLMERARFRALNGKTWNNPVLVNDLLLVRNDQEAACYRLPLKRVQP